MAEIINRVASSGLVTIDLDELIPNVDLTHLDIAPLLWQGMALKEKDFRTWVKENDWSQYQSKHVAIFCSVDAIIPMWAYMLISAALRAQTSEIFICPPSEAQERIILAHIKQQIIPEDYIDARVVVKGCSDKFAPPSVYGEIVNLVQPVAKAIMFGEPCSTVPVWKRPKKV